MNEKWDRRFIELARFYATWSKDPSTKVGAHIVRPDRTPVSYGYNGFPRGVDDSDERYANRELKYKMVVHAEENAILNALDRDALRGAILYVTPFMPCARCAASIIQAGIAEVVSIPTSPELAARWSEDIEITTTMFREARVTLRIIGA